MEASLNRFRETFRVKSARLPDWDYTSSAWYAITICTKQRACSLGEIENGTMRLSRCGQIVEEEWQRTSRLRANVALDAWVIMPNHVHGIVVICGSTAQRAEPGDTVEGTETTGEGTETFRRNVSTEKAIVRAKPDVERGFVAGREPPAPPSRLKADSLGSIVGQFKGASTKRVWGEGLREFAWQPRFYDHVIRNETALDRIRTYIRGNPLKWELDELNPNHR